MWINEYIFWVFWVYSTWSFVGRVSRIERVGITSVAAFVVRIRVGVVDDSSMGLLGSRGLGGALMDLIGHLASLLSEFVQFTFL